MPREGHSHGDMGGGGVSYNAATLPDTADAADLRARADRTKRVTIDINGELWPAVVLRQERGRLVVMPEDSCTEQFVRPEDVRR